MAIGHVFGRFITLKLMPHSGKAFLLQQGICPHLQCYGKLNSFPIQVTAPSNVRNLNLYQSLNRACNGPQHVSATTSTSVSSGSQVHHFKSFSVLKYINKPAPLAIKPDVPIGSFSTGPMKDIKKNFGNSMKTTKSFFEFLSLRDFLSTPSPFMLYGIGGLVPFSSVPIYIQLTSCYSSSLAHVQLVYGACILSFLGGVSWGFELLKPRNATFKSLGYSIFLPLVAWVGVLLYPSVTAFPVMISGIAAAGYVDIYYQPFPAWFKNLRFFLTTIVILSLFSTFVLSFTVKETNLNSNDNDVTFNDN